MKIGGGGIVGLILQPTGDVTTGLVSYWLFNEGSGTSFADSISSFNGVLTAGITWNVGSVNFDGTHSGSVTNMAAFNIGSTLTGFGWVNGAAQNGSVFFAHYDGTAVQRAWEVGANNAGSFNTLRVVLSDDGSFSAGHNKDYSGSRVLLDSTWHSFAMRFNSGVLDLFVDGIKDSSVTKNTDDPITTLFNSTAQLSFGAAFNSGVFTVQYTGAAERFRFYNIAKTDADILAMHTLGH